MSTTRTVLMVSIIGDGDMTRWTVTSTRDGETQKASGYERRPADARRAAAQVAALFVGSEHVALGSGGDDQG